jgi:hypothetical protein
VPAAAGARSASMGLALARPVHGRGESGAARGCLGLPQPVSALERPALHRVDREILVVPGHAELHTDRVVEVLHAQVGGGERESRPTPSPPQTFQPVRVTVRPPRCWVWVSRLELLVSMRATTAATALEAAPSALFAVPVVFATLLVRGRVRGWWVPQPVAASSTAQRGRTRLPLTSSSCPHPLVARGLPRERTAVAASTLPASVEARAVGEPTTRAVIAAAVRALGAPPGRVCAARGPGTAVRCVAPPVEQARYEAGVRRPAADPTRTPRPPGSPCRSRP